MRAFKWVLRSLALCAGAVAADVASAGNLVYFRENGAFGTPRELYTLDPTTGIATFRATMTGPERFFSLETDPATGTIYGIEPGASSIWKVDINTGAATFQSNTGLPTIADIAFDPTSGAMYGLARNSPTNLYKIDPITGASTLIGNTGGIVRTGLECDASGQFYAAELNGVLWKIDKNTALATLVGGPGSLSLVEDAVITAAGKLYLTDYFGKTYEVSLTTGNPTQVGNTNLGAGLLGIVEESPCSPPFTYCTAKINSLGCLPTISAGGSPSATLLSGFVVKCANVRNQKSGLLFYGVSGQSALPFQGGTLCVKSPIRRTGAQSSGGSPSPANDCTGIWSIDMNAFAHSAGPPAPLPALTVIGTIVDCQWWGRDPGFPAPNNTQLSNAAEYCVGP